MKFTVERTSDLDYIGELNVDTLEQLLEWCKKQENIIIIDAENMGLEIYDYYRDQAANKAVYSFAVVAEQVDAKLSSTLQWDARHEKLRAKG